MARFDDLPADQKAVLQLVLRQGRSYDQIAGLLKISADAVRERAHAALGALGPQDGAGLGDERRAEVGDYLLGQQDDGERLTTYAFLDGSAAGRAWARVVAGELRGAGLAGGGALPEVPEDGTDDAQAAPAAATPAAPAAAATPAAPAAAAPTAATTPAAPAAAAPAGDAPAPPAPPAAGDRPPERVSRTGGMILLGAVAVAVVIGILALAGVFGGGDDKKDKASTTTTTQTTTTAGQTQVEAQVNLRPARKGTKALAVANVVSQDGQRAIAVIGQGLSGGNRYVLWLAKGSQSKFLGFFPAVSGSGKDKGRLQGLVAAPDDLKDYDTMIISRESSDKPSAPSTIVLRGTIGQQ